MLRNSLIICSCTGCIRRCVDNIVYHFCRRLLHYEGGYHFFVQICQMGREEYTFTGGAHVSVLWTGSACTSAGVRDIQYIIWSIMLFCRAARVSQPRCTIISLTCLCCENGRKCMLQPSSEPFPVCLHFQLYVGFRLWQHISDEAVLGTDMRAFLMFWMLS